MNSKEPDDGSINVQAGAPIRLKTGFGPALVSVAVKNSGSSSFTCANAGTPPRMGSPLTCCGTVFDGPAAV